MTKGMKRLAALAVFLLPLAALTVIPASAVHDVGVFELDGNATTLNGLAGLPDDWDRVCHTATFGTATPLCTSAADANTSTVSFDIDPAGASIYTGGGSKDGIDIPSWKWKDGSVPDKDDLLHAFAARYHIPTGTPPPVAGDYLYFGGDRFDNSGDSQIGFWFFLNPVSLNPDGTFSNVHRAGTVPHSAATPGDILILSDFTVGGTSITIRVFEWVGSGGTDGSLNLIAGGLVGPADCVTIGAGDAFCATVNQSDGVASPWPFTNKSKQSTFATGELYEGGLNLATLNLANACFSSFLAETRSSQSVTAVLKDFVIGKFQVCAPTMSTTPSASGTVTPGTPVTDTATVTGTGTASPPFPSGTVTFFLCGPIATGTCTTDGASAGSGSLSPTATQGVSTATSFPAVNTVGSPLLPGRYCFRAEWPGDSNYPITNPPLKESGTGDSECFAVAKIPTSTVTTPVDGSGTETHTIVLGGSIQDKAVVTGQTTSGPIPTGNVTFFECGPAATACTTGGTQVGSAVSLGTPNGGPPNPFATAVSSAFTPTSVGSYCFRAEYGGDLVYDGSSGDGDTECFTVTTTSSTTSAQVWLPNDSATIHSGSGSTLDATPLSGTLSFTLYDGGTCSGTVLRPAETFTFSNAASPYSNNTTNSATTVSATATVSWLVVFTPAAGSNVSGSSRCESTALTITN